MYAAADLLEPIISDSSNPLYERSLYLLGKIYYWLDKEDDDPLHEATARQLFSKLKTLHPDNKLIRMYLGEQIDDGDDKTADNKGAPDWAIYQHEAMHHILDLIHWWVVERQAENGELGGKYGDDVEILRWWLPAILGAGDSLAKLGYTRLADGVWNSDLLERGFAKKIDDVEHSAELFRDTHPGMFLINYGDPEYVNRSLISMQNFRDVWTGITSHGHRHFKSYYLSATEVLSQFPYGVDVALNARALLPGLWATWYNENPELIRLFDEWCKAWIEDAARASNGKPAGILPSAVAFKDDKIGGDSKQWYVPNLTYSYYNWDHLGHVNELLYHYLGMYKITGSRAYLKPINFYNDLLLLSQREKPSLNVVPGTIEWVRQQLVRGGEDSNPSQHPMGKLFGMAKQLTASPVYDSVLRLYGHPYNNFQLTADTGVIVDGLKKISQTLRFNRPLLTSEVKFTDRVYVPGSNILMGMYTGHFAAGYEFPSLTASWKNTGNDVAVFVQPGDEQNFRAILYNFSKPKEIILRRWNLAPGEYRVSIFADEEGDGNADVRIAGKDIVVAERVDDIKLTIPSHKTILVTIAQINAYSKKAAKLADLAIHARDISLQRKKDHIEASILIHNIGNAASNNSKLKILLDEQEVGAIVIPPIASPDKLQPQNQKLSFLIKPFSGKKKLLLKVNTSQPEITTLNNKAEALIEVSVNELSVSF